MVFLRGFAPTLSLVLSLVPPVNDDRALHVRQPGYVDKYDFDTSYSFAQTLYGAQSFKNHAVLDLATQSVNPDFLSTLFQCGGEDLATSLGSTPAPSSTLASDYAPRHPEYTPYDNIGQAFATPACFSSPPVIELLELPESVDEHFAHGNYTSITVSEDAGMGIPAGVADVEKAYAAYVEQPMALTDATLSDATPSDTTPSDATLSTPTLSADIVAHAGNATEDADAELVFKAANVEPSVEITGADSEFAPPLQDQSLASGVREIINEFSAIGVHLVTIALTTFKLAIVIGERIYYRFGSIAYYVYDAAVVRHVSSLATMTYETMLASLCIIAAIAVLMYGALLYQKDFLEDISLFHAEMVTNASSRIMTSRESEGEIETSYSESDPSPSADHDNLSEDEKSGATMAPVDNNSYRCVMFTDSYARVRLSECKDMVVIRNPDLKADVPVDNLVTCDENTNEEKATSNKSGDSASSDADVASDLSTDTAETSLPSDSVSDLKTSLGGVATHESVVLPDVECKDEKVHEEKAKTYSSTGSDVQVKDAILTNTMNSNISLGETGPGSSATLSEDALAMMDDSLLGSSIEGGSDSVDSGTGCALQHMDTLESTGNPKDSQEIGPMESSLLNTIDAGSSLTILESSAKEKAESVDLEGSSTLPAFSSFEDAIVSDSALWGAPSSASIFDTSVGSPLSPSSSGLISKHAEGTAPSGPSASPGPAELTSAASSSMADVTPEAPEIRVPRIKRPANRRGGGAAARKRAREAIEMAKRANANPIEAMLSSNNVSDSAQASSASTSDDVSSELSMPPRIPSASTSDVASSESSAPPRMSAPTARASLTGTGVRNERRAPDRRDRYGDDRGQRPRPNWNDRGPSRGGTSSDSRRYEDRDYNDRRGQGPSNGYQRYHDRGERSQGPSNGYRRYDDRDRVERRGNGSSNGYRRYDDRNRDERRGQSLSGDDRLNNHVRSGQRGQDEGQVGYSGSRRDGAWGGHWERDGQGGGRRVNGGF